MTELARQLLGLLAAGSLALGLSCQARPPAPPSPATSPSPAAAPPAPVPPLRHDTVTLPQATVQTLTIANHPEWEVVPVVATRLQPLAELAREQQAIAAINGGFFDPQNGRTTSAVVRDGAIAADPQQNARLTANPDLAAVLPQILDRSEWRAYQCASGRRYAIAARSAAIPPQCQLQHALGAGPRLLPDLTAVAEGFVAIANGQTVRDAIGRDRRYARSALGIARDGSLILVMANREPEGLTLPELAALLRERGAIAALNLDGGSSASFYYQGNLYAGQHDDQGQPLQRPIKSALIVRRARPSEPAPGD